MKNDPDRPSYRRGAITLRRRLGRVPAVHLSLPPAHIQITPLVDVLLVLLVLGVLAWAAGPTAKRATARSDASSDLLQGLSLPLRGTTQTQREVALGDKALLVGVGLHGQLSWRGVPVTREILAQQLREARERESHTDVWLAADEALPYADLMVWLEWLQGQQVSRLTLLSRVQPSAGVPGKP